MQENQIKLKKYLFNKQILKLMVITKIIKITNYKSFKTFKFGLDKLLNGIRNI